jgi:hypothetical protein
MPAIHPGWATDAVTSPKVPFRISSVGEQAGAGARVMLAASCEEPLQEGGHFMTAAQELVEDFSRSARSVVMALVSQVCPAARATAWMARVALRSSMPVRAWPRLTGVPAAMLAARRGTRRSPFSLN